MADHRKDRAPSHIEITETRVGTWRVECPCGWHDDLGRYASLSIAKDHARYHMRHCPVVRDQRKIGYETNAQRWAERGAS
jgi:hypothetical protein